MCVCVCVCVAYVLTGAGEQLARAEHGLLSLLFDSDDMPETPAVSGEPVCLVQTPDAHLAAAQQHYQDGVSLDSAKRPAEATGKFKAAIALHPRHADALNALGSILSNHKHMHRKAGVCVRVRVRRVRVCVCTEKTLWCTGYLFQRAMAVEPGLLSLSLSLPLSLSPALSLSRARAHTRSLARSLARQTKRCSHEIKRSRGPK